MSKYLYFTNSKYLCSETPNVSKNWQYVASQQEYRGWQELTLLHKLLHLLWFKLLSSIFLKFTTHSAVLPEGTCALCGLCWNNRSLCSSVLKLLLVGLRTHISIYTTKSPDLAQISSPFALSYHFLFLRPLKSSHKALKADKLRKSQC